MSGDAVDEDAVAVHELAVGEHLAPCSQVAHEVPVERGAVHSPALGIGLAERKVDRAADLLVEEDMARELRDGVVQAERELPGAACAVVHRKHLPQELLTLARLSLHDLAAPEGELDVLDHPP